MLRDATEIRIELLVRVERERSVNHGIDPPAGGEQATPRRSGLPAWLELEPKAELGLAREAAATAQRVEDEERGG